MYRVISLNANGIRAAARKGFFEWMIKQDPDVVCIQETKAQVHQLTDECFSPAGYHCYYEDAVKKGYSGVAIYSKRKPDKVIRGFGIDESRQLAQWMAEIIDDHTNDAKINEIKQKVVALCEQFPVYG